MPALVADDPAVSEIAVTLPAGNVTVHCTAAGSLPAGDVKTRFKETVPFAAVVPEASANESDCPKETWAINKTVKSVAIQPVLERFVMAMLSTDRS